MEKKVENEMDSARRTGPWERDPCAALDAL